MNVLATLWSRLRPAATSGSPARISPYPDGPLLVRGDFVVQTPDGRTIRGGRGTVALCRCGRSSTKPFCDGTHKVTGFRAPAETPERPLAEPSGMSDPPVG
jgi:CDGSH-type Zn-finger protein